MSEAIFSPIPREIAQRLAEFASRRNLGKTVEVEGQSYTLDYISASSRQRLKSRGLSLYFRAAGHVIRISDHWAESEGNDGSRKLNCGSISGKRWRLGEQAEHIYYYGKGGRRFPFRLLAGRCSVAILNQTCDHWKEAA
ncbi:hypothetical protein [Zavarzinia sp.]|uniref:hypothetical protein n=1 Tax=Zavarzinia sp. TaxID=2027920 RepID=UPI003BB7EFAA